MIHKQPYIILPLPGEGLPNIRFMQKLQIDEDTNSGEAIDFVTKKKIKVQWSWIMHGWMKVDG